MEPTVEGPNNKTHNDNETKANILNKYFKSSFLASSDMEVLIKLNTIEIEERGNTTVLRWV